MKENKDNLSLPNLPQKWLNKFSNEKEIRIKEVLELQKQTKSTGKCLKKKKKKKVHARN